MKLFQKLTNLVKKLQSMQTKSILNGKTINLTSDNIAINSNNFSVNKYGKLVAKNADISGTVTIVGGDQYHPAFSVEDEEGNVHIVPYGIFVNNSDDVMVELESSQNDNSRIRMFSDDDGSLLYMGRQGQLQGGVHADGTAYFQCIGGITCRTLSQTSQAEKKKNFEKFNNALDILNNIDIYKFHYKEQKDDEKKHIGLVIGDNYKYSKEVTNEENDGVDIYSFVSTCCQAIKEQQEEIEELKKEIEKLKGGK